MTEATVGTVLKAKAAVTCRSTEYSRMACVAYTNPGILVTAS